MRPDARLILAIALLAALGASVLPGRWHGSTLGALPHSAAPLQVAVTSGADRGPGSLRDALFAADAAPGSVTIVVRVRSVAVETPLPPLVNPHGVRILATAPGAQIDGTALGGGALLDVDAEHVSMTGVGLRHCATAVLVRSGDFHFASGSIESCDVGIDLADNVHAVDLERNQFAHNRLSVRFAGTSRDSLVVGNGFFADADAGVWAVRGTPAARDAAPIEVRDNRFDDERIGVVVGNVAVLLEHNVLRNAREAAVHLLGGGAAVVRGNRISGGPAMGIVAENAVGATIADNEIDHLGAYAVMVRGSAGALVENNRVHNCGDGLAFVLGVAQRPSTAVDNVILAPRYDGIDVIGDSPILRHNRVQQAGARPLQVGGYRPAGGAAVSAHPFLDGNDWGDSRATVTAANSARPSGAPRSR